MYLKKLIDKKIFDKKGSELKKTDGTKFVKTRP